MLDPQKVQSRLQELVDMFKAWQHLKSKDPAKRTKMDKRRQEEIEVELDSIHEPQARSDLLVDVDRVARHFKVSRRTVQNWVSIKGCPKLKHGMYDLDAVFWWWQENINNGGDSEATENVKLEYWRWKTENERMRAQQTAGELLPKEEVLRMWANRLREVWSGLYGFVNRLPPLLVGKSKSVMQEILMTEARQLNEGYCRDGRFCRQKPVEEKGTPPRGRGRPKKK